MAPFLYNHPDDNVATLATPTIQTGTAVTGYGVTYFTELSDENLLRPSRLVETSGAWKLHFAAAQRVDFVMVWHNFAAALACSIKAGGTYASPTLTQALTIPAKRSDGSTVKVFVDLRSHVNYSVSGFSDYWLSVTGTNDQPIGAKIWCGKVIRQLSNNYKWGVKPALTKPGINLTTDAGHVWSYDLGVSPRLFSGQSVPLSNVDREAVWEWFRQSGRSRVTVFVPDPAVNDAWLVRWSAGVSPGAQGLVRQSLEATHRFFDGSDMPFTFEEVTAGGPEWE